MKLSDVMSAAHGLSSYAELALLIFFGVFLGVALDLWRSGARHDALSLLPLADDANPRRVGRRDGGRP